MDGIEGQGGVDWEAIWALLGGNVEGTRQSLGLTRSVYPNPQPHPFTCGPGGCLKLPPAILYRQTLFPWGILGMVVLGEVTLRTHRRVLGRGLIANMLAGLCLALHLQLG